MMRTLHLRILSCLMLAIFPCTLFAADQPAAMVYTHGTALLNSTVIPTSSALFPGDLVETNAESVANINATGSTILVLNNSIVQYEGSSITIEHGAVTVSTSKSLATRAEDFRISPVSSSLTEFEVRDVDGKVRISARKGDLTITDDSGVTTTLAQGQETTREESESQKEKKRKKAGGAAPAAGGGVLDSPVAIGIGTGIIAGTAAYVLIKSDNPASPTK